MSIDRARLKQQFGRAAATYDTHAAFQREQTQALYALATAHIPAAARVLDLGCGTGYFVQLAAGKWRVTNLDLAYAMAHTAATHAPALQADAIALPFAEASFDAVVSSLCLQWVQDLPRAMVEIRRVLRPGGRAILLTLGERTLQELRAHAYAAALPLALLPMRSEAEHRVGIAQSGLQLTALTSTLQTRHYTDLRALLDSMRIIGAGNNFQGGPRGLTGTRRWKSMRTAYESTRTAAGLPASWEVVQMLLEKSL